MQGLQVGDQLGHGGLFEGGGVLAAAGQPESGGQRDVRQRGPERAAEREFGDGLAEQPDQPAVFLRREQRGGAEQSAVCGEAVRGDGVRGAQRLAERRQRPRRLGEHGREFLRGRPAVLGAEHGEPAGPGHRPRVPAAERGGGQFGPDDRGQPAVALGAGRGVPLVRALGGRQQPIRRHLAHLLGELLACDLPRDGQSPVVVPGAVQLAHHQADHGLVPGRPERPPAVAGDDARPGGEGPVEVGQRRAAGGDGGVDVALRRPAAVPGAHPVPAAQRPPALFDHGGRRFAVEFEQRQVAVPLRRTGPDGAAARGARGDPHGAAGGGGAGAEADPQRGRARVGGVELLPAERVVDHVRAGQDEPAGQVHPAAGGLAGAGEDGGQRGEQRLLRGVPAGPEPAAHGGQLPAG